MSTATLSAALESAPPSRRLAGIVILTFFGGTWLAGACLIAWPAGSPARLPMLIAVATASAVLMLGQAHRWRRRRRRPLPVEGSGSERRRARLFHLVNGAQWLALFVVANVLNNLHLAPWILPAAIAIVGLHFLPLARLLGNPILRLTGSAMLLLALCYPWLAAGPLSPCGPLGAGLLLWATALLSLHRATRQ